MEHEEYDLDAIREKVDLVEYVKLDFERLEWSLEYRNKEWWGKCPNPNHEEKTASFCVSEEKKTFFCFGCHWGGDIFNYVMGMEGISFYKALRKLVGENEIPKIKAPVIARIFKKYKKDLQEKMLQRFFLRPDVMDIYDHQPIKEWVEEGIGIEQLEKYQVRYDLRNERIVFPIWDDKGNIIAISGRTLNPDYKELKIKKYCYYNKIQDLDFLYGYWQNKELIHSAKEMIVFEGAKSVHKAEGWGYNNVCALLTSHISPEQLPEIIKSGCKEIVLALDSDIKKKMLFEESKLLRRFMRVSYIYDKDKLLGEKMAPVDMGKEVWDKLYKERRELRL